MDEAGKFFLLELHHKLLVLTFQIHELEDFHIYNYEVYILKFYNCNWTMLKAVYRGKKEDMYVNRSPKLDKNYYLSLFAHRLCDRASLEQQLLHLMDLMDWDIKEVVEETLQRH